MRYISDQGFAHTNTLMEGTFSYLVWLSLATPIKKRKDSFAVAPGHFLLIFFLYQSAALNYKIFPRDVAVVPGLQLVSGITDARLERRTFIRLKETAHPVFVDLIFSSGKRNRNCLTHSAFCNGALSYIDNVFDGRMTSFSKH